MIALTIHYDQQMHAAIIQYIPQQSLKSIAIKGKVREHWRLKPEALGLILGVTTFLSFPLPFQSSTDSNGPDCLSLDNHCRSSDCGGVPSIGLPMLHAAIIQYIPQHPKIARQPHLDHSRYSSARSVFQSMRNAAFLVISDVGLLLQSSPSSS